MIPTEQQLQRLHNKKTDYDTALKRSLDLLTQLGEEWHTDSELYQDYVKASHHACQRKAALGRYRNLLYPIM